jgi:hypothetical protein
MKDLKEEHAAEIAGGLDLRQSEMQVAPEPEPAEPIVIDYNPDRTPK